MEETGVVKSINGAFATVSVARKSVCDECAAGTCHMTDSGAEMEALNHAGAKVGQTVKIVMKPYSYLKGTVIVYGLPGLALIAGAVIGKSVIAKAFPGSDPDLISAITGFGACGLSFLFIKLWSHSAGKKTEYKPVIEQILSG